MGFNDIPRSVVDGLNSSIRSEAKKDSLDGCELVNDRTIRLLLRCKKCGAKTQKELTFQEALQATKFDLVLWSYCEKCRESL